jgi:long-subunit fatty acid transport protein
MVRAGLALLCAFTTPALASPRSDPTEGRAVFTGATVAGAESIDLNPAAIGPSFLNAIYVGASAVLDHYHVRLDGLDPNTGAITPGSTVGDNEVAPGGLLAAIVHINDRATIGAELSSPPAESFIEGQNNLQYFTLGGSQREYRGGIAASFRVTNEFYFGVSLLTDTTYLHLHYALDTALANGNGPNGITSACGTTACGVGNPLASEHFDVHVNSPLFSTANLVANIGVLISPYKDVWVGLAYHSPPGVDAIQTELDGTMDVLQAPRDGTNLLHGAATVYISQPASADLEVRARLPRQLDLHVAGRWEDLSRLNAYDVRGYGSLFPQYNVPEWTLLPQSFHDSFAFWAGVEQAETGQFARFGARLGFETSSLDDDDTTAMVIAPRSYTADLGVQLRLALGITLQATYGVQYFPTVNVTDSAFDPRSVINCIASDYDYATSACASTRNGYGIESADGSYQRWEQTFRVMLRRDL